MDEEIYPKSRFSEPDRLPGGLVSHPATSPLVPCKGEADREPREPPRSSGRLTPIRSRRGLLFAALGLAGGVVGALVAELTPGVGPDADLLEACYKTGIWSALTAASIGMALFMANDLHQHRLPRKDSLIRSLLAGVAGGLMAGMLAEFLFQSIGGGASASYLAYAAGWSALGIALAAALSLGVPNMGMGRGTAAGALGGACGGLGFASLGTAPLLPEMVARMTGAGILGLSLGLAIVVVDRLFREASLEVVWAPNESSFFNLGSEPVRIGGGGQDEIHVRGLGAGFAHILFTNGRVEYVEAESGRRTPLKNGSSLQIGPLQLVIHAAA